MTTALEAFERHKGKLATFRRRFLGNHYRDQPSSSIDDECIIIIGDVMELGSLQGDIIKWEVEHLMKSPAESGFMTYDSHGVVSGQNDEHIVIQKTSGSGNEFEDTYWIHVI